MLNALVLLEGFWQLEEIIENVAGQPPVQHDFLSIPTPLVPEELLNEFASPSTIGFWTLPAFIKQTQNAGLDTTRYKMRYQSLLALPVLFVAMGLIGAIVCLRLSRPWRNITTDCARCFHGNRSFFCNSTCLRVLAQPELRRLLLQLGLLPCLPCLQPSLLSLIARMADTLTLDRPGNHDHFPPP